MTHDVPSPTSPGSVTLHRRSVLGIGLAAGVLIPLVGTGMARAESGTGTTSPSSEEYEIPDGIGSAPWW